MVCFLFYSNTFSTLAAVTLGADLFQTDDVLEEVLHRVSVELVEDQEHPVWLEFLGQLVVLLTGAF